MAHIRSYTASHIEALLDTNIVDGDIPDALAPNLDLEQRDGTPIDGGLIYDPSSLDDRLTALEPDAGDGIWHYVGSGGGEPAFVNGSNLGGIYRTTRFRRDRKMVRIEGLVVLTLTTASQIIFTLPVGYRPSYRHIVNVNANMITGPASAGTAHTHTLSSRDFRVSIDQAGNVQTAGPGAFQASSHVSLCGIKFFVD